MAVVPSDIEFDSTALLAVVAQAAETDSRTVVTELDAEATIPTDVVIAKLRTRGVRCSEDQLYRAGVALFAHSDRKGKVRLYTPRQLELLEVALPLVTLGRVPYAVLSLIKVTAQRLGIDELTMYQAFLEQALVERGLLARSA